MSDLSSLLAPICARETAATADEVTFNGDSLDQDYIRALEATAEDIPRLLSALDAVEALAEEWRYKGEFGWGAWQEGHGPDETGAALDHASSELRTAVTAALGEQA